MSAALMTPRAVSVALGCCCSRPRCWSISQASRPAAVLDMWRPWGEDRHSGRGDDGDHSHRRHRSVGRFDDGVGQRRLRPGLAARLAASNWPPGRIAGPGLAAGAVNASLVALGVPPLVATLATMAFYAGLAMSLSEGQRIAGLPERFTALGQGSWLPGCRISWRYWPWPVRGLARVHHTRFGRYLFAIGENRLAARFAAVPIRRVEWTLYTASGLLAAARGSGLHRPRRRGRARGRGRHRIAGDRLRRGRRHPGHRRGRGHGPHAVRRGHSVAIGYRPAVRLA